ncbi:hypothetical protein DNI29_23220 [Hymenobacter sediminis]|uniref:hypothetical protein n=1 Tax=Hymenobacter sediminis TaxID=2218621 RepID=UPI000DA64154|nr:hypothetical protein [Hymenobacter sediminis]RPD43773.1 hypothetical protein DNI29_23220 [Hymenobacter sediminis]
MRPFLGFSFVFLLLASGPTLGQTHSAPTGPDNAAWLDSVQHLSLPQQVAAVRRRAWRDTLLAPYQTPVCGMGVATTPGREASARKLPASPKPAGFPLVYVVNGQAFYHNDAATVRQWQCLLRHQPIRQVTLLRDETAMALYGSRAAYGVVVLSSTKVKRR